MLNSSRLITLIRLATTIESVTENISSHEPKAGFIAFFGDFDGGGGGVSQSGTYHILRGMACTKHYLFTGSSNS